MSQLALFARSTRHVTWPALCVRDKALAGLSYQALCVDLDRIAATRRAKAIESGGCMHGTTPKGACGVARVAFVVDAVTGRLNPPDPRWPA